jgi:hypothetical protein
MKRLLGYVPDDQDLRDLRLGSSSLAFGVSSVPSAYLDMAHKFGHRLFVQSAQSCVGFSIAEALVARWATQGVWPASGQSPIALQLPSPRFIWFNSRILHRAERRNVGTYIRGALKQLERLGHCPEAECESLDGADSFYAGERPSQNAYRVANDRKLKGFQYYRVDPRNEYEWKVALANDDPIVFGMPVTDRYCMLKAHQYYTEDPNTTVIGGHAQCALGYDEHGVIGPGTWGSGFGNAGWWSLSWEQVTRTSVDVWALRVPGYYH